MKTDTARWMISRMHYFPNWTIRVTDIPEGPDGFVDVTFLVETWNTDRENARAGYPERVTLERQRLLDVRGLDEFGLRCLVFSVITDIEQHERREAFRVGRDMHAPFHPHRLSGDRNWKRFTRDLSE